MRVAVTGASGFVGGRTVAALATRGHEVVAFGRRPLAPGTFPAGVEYLRWDLLDGPLGAPPPVDAVVHAAGAVDDWGPAARFERVNVGGTATVLATFPAAHVVHVSSASVYDDSSDVRAVREDAPLPTRCPSAYVATKIGAEEVVRTRRPDAAILRPHAVWGPGDTTLLPRLLRARVAGVLLVPGNGRNRLSVTHVDNLTLAVAVAVEARASGTFNVSDGHDLTVDGLLRLLLRRLGLRPRIAYVPAGLAQRLAALDEAVARRTGRRPPLTRYAVLHLTHEWTLDITRAREVLGYAPRWTAEDGPLDG